MAIGNAIEVPVDDARDREHCDDGAPPPLIPTLRGNTVANAQPGVAASAPTSPRESATERTRAMFGSPRARLREYAARPDVDVRGVINGAVEGGGTAILVVAVRRPSVDSVSSAGLSVLHLWRIVLLCGTVAGLSVSAFGGGC